MSQYPEHEKLTVVREMAQSTGEFMEYLEDKGYFIAEWKETDHGQNVMVPVRKSITQWLAEMFDIDLVKLDQEKDVMQAEQRALNERKASKDGPE